LWASSSPKYRSASIQGGSQLLAWDERRESLMPASEKTIAGKKKGRLQSDRFHGTLKRTVYELQIDGSWGGKDKG